MKRFATAAAAAIIAASVLSGVRAEAHDDRCLDGVTFVHCGEYVPLNRLPLTFHLNNAGSPGSVSASRMRDAIRGAIDEWNRAWPKALVTGNGVRIEFGTDAPFRYGGSTTATAGDPSSGRNTIGWGDVSRCPGHGGDPIAVACLWYSDAAKTKISKVDIILNPAGSWRFAEGVDALTGELRGSAWISGAGSVSWFDVQSVLTHELGHAIGLDDIGDPNRRWPGDLTDAPKHRQTMYRWYTTGSTNKRSLGDGDILGLQVVAWEAARKS